MAYCKYECIEGCGAQTSRVGRKCRECYLKEVRVGPPDNRRHVVGRSDVLSGVRDALQEEAKLSPELDRWTRLHGDWMLLSDPHIPFHHTETIVQMCETAQMLGIKNLCVPGDLIHADTISQYDQAGKTVAIRAELECAGRVLEALLSVFDRIEIIVGNHDQRIEKLVAKWAQKDGKHLASLMAGVLKVEDEAEAISYGIFRHFLGNPDRVIMHPLPEIVINDKWLIQHPSQCSRKPPTNQINMIHKWRLSVVGGHNHLWGLAFDNSAVDCAFNIGPACDSSKWRYMRERVTDFPRQVNGYAAIIQTDDNPGGMLIPMALHDRMFNMKDLMARLDANREKKS